MVSGEPHLLTDDQMKSFITNGFLMLKTDFSKQFHAQLVEKLNVIYEEEGNPGNNVLPRIREMQKVFEHPVIVGALQSLLGPDYLLHTHRHGHYNSNPKPGAWHKDSYWGYYRIRNHHPWWAMILYFPQDTPVELGPTGVMPGTQYWNSRTFEAEESEQEALASGEAGTFVLIHYDLWHRATPNMLGTPRFMIKFEFVRTQAPVSPSWNNVEPSWSAIEGAAGSDLVPDVMGEEVWNWLSGRVGSLANTMQDDAQAIHKLAVQLEDANEPNAMAAAYELAARGNGGTEALLRALRHKQAGVSKIAAYGLSVAGEHAVPGLIEALRDPREETVNHAVFALGELRSLALKAMPDLVALTGHDSVEVRRTVMDTMGMIGMPEQLVVQGLIQGLQDSDPQVRFTAALSLVRMGHAGEPAIPYLAKALDDENRYVQGHAVEALRYIGTKEANDILLKELMNSRWCPSTTPASSF